jgi:hypothetical protein
MFQYTASDHYIEEVVRIRELVWMSQLRIFQTCKVEERAIFESIDIAAVDFHIFPSQHSNQTSICSMTATPVKHCIRVSDDIFATLKNTDLPADDCGISRVTVQVGIASGLRLERIESGKFLLIVRHYKLSSSTSKCKSVTRLEWVMDMLNG